MNRELLVRLFSLVWLVFVWVLLWGTITLPTMLAGLAVAAFITFALPLPRVPVEGRLHPLSFVWLVLTCAYEMIKSSVEVAWLALRPSPPPPTALVEHEFRVRSDLSLALLVDVLNNIPGSMVVELDHTRRIGFVHLLDGGSDEQIAAFRQTIETIESRFIRAFERPEDWKESPHSPRTDPDTELT
ncbi:Na+/H+ antiporter subunit E [Rhodococcus rhodnii]|uniref:Na+/H+ antiporter subunit E n=2 Tax=Rhodococcus rhodnii TaxID=38312 RepID=A0A6P2CJG9_9NOCA|nr:Na+/H+ antiporter subunit E [Rhodococcus rhodnii]